MQAGQAGQEMGDGAHPTECRSVVDKILTKVINLQNLVLFLHSFFYKSLSILVKPREILLKLAVLGGILPWMPVML